MARPIAETFRESVSHVDFFENDLVLTEDVAMPDSEVGLEYSAYVERVENRLDRAVKDVVFARGDDLDLAYASSHGDDVLGSSCQRSTNHSRAFLAGPVGELLVLASLLLVVTGRRRQHREPGTLRIGSWVTILGRRVMLACRMWNGAATVGFATV